MFDSTQPLPFVSVCLPTYKRPDFLSEFFWCYLNQDYPKDRRELIILDDAGQFQPFIDLQENIKLISLKTRFPTLGEKRNRFLSLMNEQSEFLFIADDDDLYYPHWLSTMVRAGEHADLIVPSMMIEWFWEREPIYRSAVNWGYHNAASAFRKKAFMELGGYPHRQRQEDYVLFEKFEMNKDKYKKAEIYWKEFPYIIRRSGCWRGTYTTTFMDDQDYEKTSQQTIESNLVLTPSLSAERYLQMAKEQIKKQYEDERIIIHSTIVGHGVLGINEPGYTALDLPENMIQDNYLILSAHCPSELKVTFKKKVTVKGVMNGSSHWSPTASCLFLVSENIVGYLFGPKDSTREMILEPGDYTLEITSPEPSWKHSLWAVREIPEI
ncbi:MAG: glycosyltransferase family 2 protein [Planctomycetaceae bacterium]|jgi:hypothetical protein|nr:glycosyltransferase family 2 protein [Planctomycetaceae bacterium]